METKVNVNSIFPSSDSPTSSWIFLTTPGIAIFRSGTQEFHKLSSTFARLFAWAVKYRLAIFR